MSLPRVFATGSRRDVFTPAASIHPEPKRAQMRRSASRVVVLDLVWRVVHIANRFGAIRLPHATMVVVIIAVGGCWADPSGAHGFAGKRFFPATLATDDPFVADELSLPTLS